MARKIRISKLIISATIITIAGCSNKTKVPCERAEALDLKWELAYRQLQDKTIKQTNTLLTQLGAQFKAVLDDSTVRPAALKVIESLPNDSIVKQFMEANE